MARFTSKPSVIGDELSFRLFDCSVPYPPVLSKFFSPKRGLSGVPTILSIPGCISGFALAFCFSHGLNRLLLVQSAVLLRDFIWSQIEHVAVLARFTYSSTLVPCLNARQQDRIDFSLFCETPSLGLAEVADHSSNLIFCECF